MHRCQYNLGSDREATLMKVTEVSKEINSVPICVSANDSLVLRYVHEVSTTSVQKHFHLIQQKEIS